MLSLLLVLSQQMGMTHALSHWSGNRNATAQLEQRPDVAKTLALHQSCEQCLAFAQIGAALDTPIHSFPLGGDTAAAILAGGLPELCQRTVCVFLSRAPPVLA